MKILSYILFFTGCGLIAYPLLYGFITGLPKNEVTGEHLGFYIGGMVLLAILGVTGDSKIEDE